jgi:hypothetical protein
MLAPSVAGSPRGFGTRVVQEAKALVEELADAPAGRGSEGLAAAGSGAAGG